MTDIYFSDRYNIVTANPKTSCQNCDGIGFNPYDDHMCEDCGGTGDVRGHRKEEWEDSGFMS